MVRKKKQSEDAAPPADEVVIEGSAERIPDEDINEDINEHINEDIGADVDAGVEAGNDAGNDKGAPRQRQNGQHQLARLPHLRRLLIALLLLAGLAISGAALSLSWINRLAIDAVNSNLAMQATLSQQQAGQIDQIEADLDALMRIDAASSADTADKDAALAQRLDAVEDQIAALRAELTALEDQLARLPATPEAPLEAADDMMIMAEQLAELEQRVNKLLEQLEGQLEGQAPLQSPDQDQLEDQLKDQAEDQNTADDVTDDTLSPDPISPDPISPDPILLEALFNRISAGQPFADILDITEQDHPALSELRPWADAPPASASALWDELDQLLTNHLNPDTDTDTNTDTDTSDDSWWGWLLAPLSDAVKITPITPELEAKTTLTTAWQNRDADLAIKAAAELAETHPAIADWHDAMLQRQALDQVAAQLATRLEE